MHAQEDEEVNTSEQPTIENPLAPERQPSEPFWAYKERLKTVNSILKARRKGLLVWDAERYGTYRKNK